MSFGEDGLPQEGGLILIDSSRGVYGCDIRPGVWHTIFALAPDTVLFEVKPGPYDPGVDKEFAPWSPPEHSPEAALFLAEVEDGFRRLWGLTAAFLGAAACSSQTVETQDLASLQIASDTRISASQ